MKSTISPGAILPLCLLSLLSGCVLTGPNSATGGGNSVNADSGLERCSETLGTIAIDDGRTSSWYHEFGRSTDVTTVEPLLRLVVQQSNCFVITAIGNERTSAQIKRITEEQRHSGEYRPGSKQQTGQRVAADYFMEPQIVLQDAPIARFAQGACAMFPNSIGCGLGGVEMKSSNVTLTLTDIRSTVQLAMAQGSSTSMDFGGAMTALGESAGTVLGGFVRTPSGKASVAAFTNAYNAMVRSLKNYKAQEVAGGLGRGGVLKVN